jgi:class 3 adenylate cyclase
MGRHSPLALTDQNRPADFVRAVAPRSVKQKEFHYRWEFDLRATPQALWPLVADTNRFNRDAGVPALDGGGRAETSSAGRNARRRLRLSKLGVKVEWEEEPFEWVRPRRFGVVRRYRSGPVAEMRVAAELREREGGGTRLVYEVWARPRGPLGRAAIPIQIGRLSARKFAETFRRYDELALREERARAAAPPPLGGSERQLLDALERRLHEEGADARLASRLVETVKHGDEIALARLRPYALADAWREPRRAALELCLQATRAGLLDLRWELICPHCRGAKHSAESLRDVRPEAHCDSCELDFTVEFDRLVEVVFRPNPAVRKLELREFCVGGPQVTPHIVAQQLLRAGERRELRAEFEEGGYRLRAHGARGSQTFFVARDGEPSHTFRAEADGWPTAAPRLAPSAALAFENATGGESLFVVERTAWSDEAATAAEVTALQLFRDLFAAEALRPGDRINVGQMTLLFTDLRDSTRMYREIGDAVAFGAVMGHFDVLRDAIAAEGGAVVKTLGDAVMAVFPRPAPALRAILHAQAALAAPPAGLRPLMLKAGIHTGPCIAVTLNERLDYFGSHVNITARLEPLSTGRDCVISEAVRRDPTVAEMLADPQCELTTEPVEARLKGFDDESFQLWRVTRRQD